MKISIIKQKFRRDKNNTYVTICTCLRNDNGPVVDSGKTFYGIAKCCPEDKFDYNFGKKIALARAEMKAINFYDKYLGKVYLEMKKHLVDIEDTRAKLFDQYNHNDNYIKKLVSGSNI